MGLKGSECSSVLVTIPLTLSHKISDFRSNFRKKGKSVQYGSTQVYISINLQVSQVHKRVNIIGVTGDRAENEVLSVMMCLFWHVWKEYHCQEISKFSLLV